MYTSYIGKKFLKLHNEKNNTSYTAEEFFAKIMYPLFFDSERHLMHVGNSPFFQKPKPKDVELAGSKTLAQFNNLKEAIANDEPNMSIMVGAPAKDLKGVTSGQISNINHVADKEEVYASWIGQALGIGVSGGYVMLIDRSEIYEIIYKGWKYYREYLTQTPNVKDRQIETWNGQWLNHIANNRFELSASNIQIETKNTQGKIGIPTIAWGTVIFHLSKLFPNSNTNAYCYNLSQTNTTLGFINLLLPEVRRYYEIRDVLFIDEKETILSEEDIEALSTYYSFDVACQQGTIGLKSIEPADLRKYMPKGSALYAQGQELKINDDDSYKQYQLFKIWIIAMLNKTELLELASTLAETLIKFEKLEERGKKTLSTLSKGIRESKNIKSFIDNLTEVLPHIPDGGDLFKTSVEAVLKMPIDNFPLFITLLRFEYALKTSK